MKEVTQSLLVEFASHVQLGLGCDQTKESSRLALTPLSLRLSPDQVLDKENGSASYPHSPFISKWPC